MTIGEIHKHVNEHCNITGGTSKSAIQRGIKNSMNEGKWTWKKLTTQVAENFAPANVNYCQEFLNYTSLVDPYKLKFFDKSGIKLPDVGRQDYGHSLVGSPGVEILQYASSPNITLNFMCGLEGIVYANTVNGTSNTLTFLNFFEEAVIVHLPNRKPAFSYRDHLIVDNAPIHHYRVGQALGKWLDDRLRLYSLFAMHSTEFNPA